MKTPNNIILYKPLFFENSLNEKSIFDIIDANIATKSHFKGGIFKKFDYLKNRNRQNNFVETNYVYKMSRQSARYNLKVTDVLEIIIDKKLSFIL